jgi:quercetin dioxygenase-like cupin family protein
MRARRASSAALQEGHMRRWKIGVAIGGAMAVALLGVQALRAQQPGFKRTELQKHDLATPRGEVVQARAEFDPGGAVGRHTHPGEEVSYVLEGSIELEVDGKTQTVEAGKPFFIPAGVVHAAKNNGQGKASVLSTYIVEKGKPLATAMK